MSRGGIILSTGGENKESCDQKKISCIWWNLSCYRSNWVVCPILVILTSWSECPSWNYELRKFVPFLAWFQTGFSTRNCEYFFEGILHKLWLRFTSKKFRPFIIEFQHGNTDIIKTDNSCQLTVVFPLPFPSSLFLTIYERANNTLFTSVPERNTSYPGGGPTVRPKEFV